MPVPGPLRLLYIFRRQSTICAPFRWLPAAIAGSAERCAAARRAGPHRPADRPLGRRAAAAARATGTEPLQLDVTDPASITAAARQVAERYAKLDVLVNNAAITYDTWQRAVDADLAVVREAAETNLYGPWLMVQRFLPLLRASEHPRIVNVSSEAASLASLGGGTPAYTASKVATHAHSHDREQFWAQPANCSRS